MKLVLTGASGYLGYNLLKAFLNDGLFDVELILRRQSILKNQIDTKKFKVHRFDYIEDVANIIQNIDPDVIVHTAGCYGRKGEKESQLIDVNIRYGLILMEAANRRKGKVVFINSSTSLKSEVSAYALSKVQFSEWGREISCRRESSLRFADLKLQHFYGPDDDSSKFTSHLIRGCLAPGNSIQLTEGQQLRDFIHIDDVVAAYIKIIKNSSSLEKYQSIDVGSGEARTIREFAELVHRLSASESSLIFGALPYRANEQMLSVADLSWLKKFGWSPIYSLEEGLKTTIEQEREKLAPAAK